MKPHQLFARKKNARLAAAGCVALAAGGIVLLKAPAHPQASATALPTRPMVTAPATPITPIAPTPASITAPRAQFQGPGVHGTLALAQGAVVADGTRHVYAELRVSADRAEQTNTERPIAFAVVLDVSGSMSGEKIEQARNSVRTLIDQMRPMDHIALVTYSDNVRVVQPLARIDAVREHLRTVIPTIQIEGGTNIPLGLNAGATALSDAPAGMVRRIVLLSDGQDTSGRPVDSTAADVRSRAEQGITVSALGIGVDYDEHFMSRMADAGRGNYEFLRDGTQIAPFLARELRQTSSTTIDRAVVDLQLPNGWRLERSTGVEAVGTTGAVRLPLGSLFAGDERRIILDFAVDAGAAGGSMNMNASMAYYSVPNSRDQRIDAGALALRFVNSEAEATASRDLTIFAEAESTLIAMRQREAVDAWQRGDTATAQSIASSNIAALNRLQAMAPRPTRAAQIRQFNADAQNFITNSARSAAGRAWGLSSGAMHRRALSVEAAYE